MWLIARFAQLCFDAEDNLVEVKACSKHVANVLRDFCAFEELISDRSVLLFLPEDWIRFVTQVVIDVGVVQTHYI